jgi:predicted transcriptional regulator
MSLAEKLAKVIETAEEDHNYWMDLAVTDFTRDLHERMRQLDISQGELARRMGTSRPYVTKLLSGGNFTLQTMVKLAMAIDSVVRVRLEGNEVRAAQRQTAAAVVASGGTIVDLTRRREQRTVSTAATDSYTLPLDLSWGR